MEYPNTHSKDLVESTLAQVKRLKIRDDKLHVSGFDEPRVPTGRCRDHVRGTIHGDEVTASEPLANQGRGNAMTAADLKDTIIGADVQLLNDRLNSIAHVGVGNCCGTRTCEPL